MFFAVSYFGDFFTDNSAKYKYPLSISVLQYLGLEKMNTAHSIGRSMLQCLWYVAPSSSDMGTMYHVYATPTHLMLSTWIRTK